jgi:GNAT superfamily N-acetyltransferase
MRVVLASSQDIVPWLALAAQVEPLFGPMLNDPVFLRALERNVVRGTAFCVREGDGLPGVPLMGGLLFSPRAHCPAQPARYRISWLAVAASHRRQGVGRLLVEYVFGLVRPPAEIAVTTFGPDAPGGEPARAFYERMGFSPAEQVEDGPEGGSRQVYRCYVKERTK